MFKKLANSMRLILLFAMLTASCAAQSASTTDEEASKKPVQPMQPGQLVESVDAHTVRVMCTGVGDGTKGATVNARQSCLDWFVRTGLGFGREDIQKYLGIREEIFAKLDTFIEVPGPARMGGVRKGILSRTTMETGLVRIRCIVDLYKSRLKDHLARSGLAGAAAPGGGKPVTVVVLPSKNFRTSSKRPIVQNLIAAHLIGNKFQVIEAGESATSEADEEFTPEQTAGADIVVSYEAMRTIKGPAMSYTVMLNAFETSSGRTVGAATALSSQRPKILPAAENAAIKEATAEALSKLESQLLAHFNEESVSGATIRIAVRGGKPGSDIRFHQVLKRFCSSVKVIANQPENLEVLVRCKMDSLDLAAALGEAIQEKGIAEDFDVPMKTKKQIVFQLK